MGGDHRHEALIWRAQLWMPCLAAHDAMADRRAQA
jgi:hypothetical protein